MLERIRTGSLLILFISIIGYINNPTVMYFLFSLIYFFAIKESIKLFKVEKVQQSIYILSAITILFILPNSSFNLNIIISSLFLYLGLHAYDEKFKIEYMFPFLYPTIGVLFIFNLYQDYNLFALIWLIIIVSSTDIGAYFVGKFKGKTKFSETSPNKTLEGVFGGILVSTILSFIFLFIYSIDTDVLIGNNNTIDFNNDLFKLTIISFVASVFSILGDLFESKLKRQAGVKDSGNILPGHGGILDRLDGFLFSSIILYTMIEILF
jgi:phosphatidate cytidylyltransferase